MQPSKGKQIGYWQDTSTLHGDGQTIKLAHGEVKHLFNLIGELTKGQKT